MGILHRDTPALHAGDAVDESLIAAAFRKLEAVESATGGWLSEGFAEWRDERGGASAGDQSADNAPFRRRVRKESDPWWRRVGCCGAVSQVRRAERSVATWRELATGKKWGRGEREGGFEGESSMKGTVD